MPSDLYYDRYHQAFGPKSRYSFSTLVCALRNVYPHLFLKRLLVILLLLGGGYSLHAQERIQRPRGTHQHDGFYLSMNLGPVMGNVMDYVNGTPSTYPFTVNFFGPGSAMDLKMGWAVHQNLILHATLISSTMVGPKVETTVNGITTPNQVSSNYNMGEVMVGGGMTYYFMPYNIFLSGNIGRGNFVVSGNENSAQNGVTDDGFSMQLKMGKEWWVSKNWGLGVALSYSKTNVDNRPANPPSEQLRSSRFGILFNTTFN